MLRIGPRFDVICGLAGDVAKISTLGGYNIKCGSKDQIFILFQTSRKNKSHRGKHCVTVAL